MLNANLLDTHCHLWELGRGDYDWLNERKPELALITRDFTPLDLETAHGTTGVNHSILVQAAASDAETEFLLALAKQQASIVGVVGWVDLGGENVVGRLSELDNNAHCFGIRPMLQDIPVTDWILQQEQKVGLNALNQSNLCFDALVTSRHLDVLYTVCENYPEIPVIIDHAAKPPLSKPNSQQYEQWLSGMEKLATKTSALCKFSGLLTEMSPEQRSCPDKALGILKPMFEQLLEWFGHERLVWGSDWPVLTLAASYDDWFDITEELLSVLSASEQKMILGNNAMKFYNIDSVTV